MSYVTNMFVQDRKQHLSSSSKVSQNQHCTTHRGLTNSGSLRLARMLPFSAVFSLLGLLSLGDVSSGGGGGGGGGATFSLLGEIVSSNHSPRMGSLSSSENTPRATFSIAFNQVTVLYANKATLAMEINHNKILNRFKAQ